MNKTKYQTFLNSEAWKQFRSYALVIFENRCWFCGYTQSLHLHHTKYFGRVTNKLSSSTRFIYNNLRWVILLCSRCHYGIHKIQREEHKEVYLATRLFQKRYFPGRKMNISKEKAKQICHVYREKIGNPNWGRLGK